MLSRDVIIVKLIEWLANYRGAGEFQISPQVWQQIEKVNPVIALARMENARSPFEVERPEATLKELRSFPK